MERMTVQDILAINDMVLLLEVRGYLREELEARQEAHENCMYALEMCRRRMELAQYQGDEEAWLDAREIARQALEAEREAWSRFCEIEDKSRASRQTLNRLTSEQ